MKRLLPAALMGACLACAETKNTFDWTAPVGVTNAVLTKKVSSVTFSVLPNGRLQAAVVRVVTDAGGRTVATFPVTYTHAQLLDQLGTNGVTLARFKEVFLAVTAENR